MIFKWTTLVMMAVFFVACSSGKNSVEELEAPLPSDCSEGEVSDVGIINGKKVKDGSWIESSTGLLLFDHDNHSGLCTVSLVSRDVILTAAHCVTENGFLFNGNVHFGANPSCDQEDLRRERQVSIKEIIVHPKYRDDVVGFNDLALVRLSRKAPKGFFPAKVAGEDTFKKLSDPSTQFVAVGYGNIRGYNKGYSHFPRLRTTPIHYFSDHKEKLGTQDLTDLVLDQKNGGMCSGDSGGPLYAKIKDQVYIAGVNSAVDKINKSEDPCSGYSIAMSINNHRAFLQKAFDELAPGQKNPF
ncbi:MAG: trypsin-like serine protease [Pseudobdellovibrionaceae bacterium]